MLRCYHQCLEIIGKVNGKNDIECADILNNIGATYNSQGNYT